MRITYTPLRAFGCVRSAGPPTDVAMNARELFYDLEQTQGPFAANVSIGATTVVQTRVQEIKANETAGLVGISCSVAFGTKQLGASL
jgi:hypothetical protein